MWLFVVRALYKARSIGYAILAVLILAGPIFFWLGDSRISRVAVWYGERTKTTQVMELIGAGTSFSQACDPATPYNLTTIVGGEAASIICAPLLPCACDAPPAPPRTAPYACAAGLATSAFGAADADFNHFHEARESEEAARLLRQRLLAKRCVLEPSAATCFRMHAGEDGRLSRGEYSSEGLRCGCHASSAACRQSAWRTRVTTHEPMCDEHGGGGGARRTGPSRQSTDARFGFTFLSYFARAVGS